jgi:uncharacterized OB-fold protein
MSMETHAAASEVADWTTGAAAIVYQSCERCHGRWSFRRSFCPFCGSTQIQAQQASGRGTVYAATLVTRAPSEALRALAPYRIVLVDAEEGFRAMAHGAVDLAIGDDVTAGFKRFGEQMIPFFERRS